MWYSILGWLGIKIPLRGVLLFRLGQAWCSFVLGPTQTFRTKHRDFFKFLYHTIISPLKFLNRHVWKTWPEKMRKKYIIFYIDDVTYCGCKRNECLMFYVYHVIFSHFHEKDESWIFLLIFLAWFVIWNSLVIKRQV